MVRNLLLGAVVALLVISLAALSATVWWAKTAVTAADAALWVERENVKAAKAYAEAVKKALDQKTEEANVFKAECGRLQAEAAEKRKEVTP